MRKYSNFHLYWEALDNGKCHPFQVRALKAEILHRTGSWEVLNVLLNQDLAIALKYGMIGEQGRCWLRLGMLDSQLGSVEEAEKKISLAWQLYDTIGDREGSFLCRARLARLALGTKKYEQAEKITNDLLKEARTNGDCPAEIQMLNNRGMLCMHTGRYEEAVNVFNLTIEIHRKLGDNWSIAHTLGNIGNVHFDNERYIEAADFYGQSVILCREVGNFYSEYYALYNLALTCERLGQIEPALAHYQHDLKMARQLGDGPGEATILDDIKRIEDLLAKTSGFGK